MADLHSLLEDLRAEMTDLDRIVAAADDLQRPTPAEGWTIHDTVGHLAFFDRESVLAITDPEAFTAKVAAMDPATFMDDAVAEMRARSAAELLELWRAGRDRELAALGQADPKARLPWYGPPMNPLSFATARLMEYWAHGQDVADALGVRREPTDRLRHICHLGVRTRGFAYANRGLPAAEGEVYVEVTSPGGDTWSWGDPEAADRVTGTAEHFALLVTQRRHRDDLDLDVIGPLAEEWVCIAQAFAGPPGPGRPPLRG
jgi:uncharacterized protein (TIGR03084 family)